MEFWQAIVVALVSVAATGVVTYFVGRENGRRQVEQGRIERQEEEFRDWRKDGAAVIAAVQTDVFDRFTAETLRLLPHDKRLELYAYTLADWRTHRTGLRRIAAGHPSEPVLKAALKVQSAGQDLAEAVGLAIDTDSRRKEIPQVHEVLAAINDPDVREALSPATPEQIQQAWDELDMRHYDAYLSLEALRQALLDQKA